MNRQLFLAFCQRILQKVGSWFARSFQKILEFWEYNPSYLICSIIYYVLSSVLLGGTVWNFLGVLLIYVIALTIAFSELGEKLLRLMNHVRPLETKRETDYILPLFQEVYSHAKEKYSYLDEIELCMIDNMTVNAMAIGKRTIAVTKGAMETFSEEELKAVLAHEVAHILHGDTLASLYAIVGNGIFTVYILINRFFLFLLDLIDSSASRRRNIFSLILTFTRFIFETMIYLFSFLMQIAMSANSRISEYRADKFAYDIGYDSDMIEALYLLEKISLGDNSTIIQKMIASHPRITLRINRLEWIDEQREKYHSLTP
ncbi:MAG: M48 family metalloprotease [Ruminococcus sp.]|nr:M48 family metalloprotease [Ruminococcus sp.]